MNYTILHPHLRFLISSEHRVKYMEVAGKLQCFAALSITCYHNKRSGGPAQGGGDGTVQMYSLDRQGTIHETSDRQRNVKGETGRYVHYVMIGYSGRTLKSTLGECYICLVDR